MGEDVALMCRLIALGDIRIVAERHDSRLGKVILEQVSWPEDIFSLAPPFSCAVFLVNIHFF